ncbi:hypothetical protein COOONC_26166 [Cooperia oncophora]
MMGMNNGMMPGGMLGEVHHFGPGGLQLTNEQKRILFLFEYKLGTAAEVATQNINQAFGAGVVPLSQVQAAYRQFSNWNGVLG